MNAFPESNASAATTTTSDSISMVSKESTGEEEDLTLSFGGHETTMSPVETTTVFSPQRHKSNAAERILYISTTTGVEVQQPVPEFVCHLYSMLIEASYSDLISWIVPTEDEPLQMGGGICGIGKIVVHNPKALQEEVLGSYYRHSKYASFQRQLNYFGFKKRLHSGKKGKLSPCSYIHKSLTADIGSLFTLKRRPPSKRRLSQVSKTSTVVESDSTENEMSTLLHRENARILKRLRRSDDDPPPERKLSSNKKQSSANHQAVEAEVHCGAPSSHSVLTWENKQYQAHNASSTKKRMLHISASSSSPPSSKIAPTASEKQPTLVELLSKSLPPTDILFNDDVDSVDNDGVPAWLGDDGQFHYHNVDSCLIDLAMLY